ncbi:MAG TPA: hypothetical protein VGE45_17040 [Chloroflexia bacterium]|jgi:hypothetical protein
MEWNVTIDDFQQNVAWLHPWEAVKPGLEVYLKKEVGRGHVLSGVRAISVGHRVDNDDVLFFLPDSPSPLAVIHLTYSPVTEDNPEYTPDFPWTVLYSSLEEWAEKCLVPNHLEYQNYAK